MIQYHTVDLHEVGIHYAEAPGPGPALVILHGITGALDTYAPLLPTLAQQAHVYVIDLRGHNLSGRTPGAYQVADYGRDVADFLQQIVGQPAVVAGHSLGAVVAVWLVAHAPGWVQGIFLEDPPLYFTHPPRGQQALFYGFFTLLRDYLRQHHANGRTLDDMVVFVSQLPANEKQTMLEAAGPEAVRMRAVELQRMDPAILDPAIEGTILGPYESDDLLAQIRCPIHLLAAQAEFGGAMDAQDVQRFVAHVPHCTYAVLEGVGHGIHQERPDAYLEALRRFLRQFAT